jgi:DNA invertase Pin-like site-specific DNA recombinase
LIYTRISLDPLGVSVSPDRQERLCTQAVEARDGWSVAGVFSDRDKSGWNKSVKRPGFEALKAAIAAGLGDAVVAYSLSRISRRVSDLLGLLEFLDAHDASLVLYDQHIDTGTPAGKLLFTVVAALAEMESEQTSEKVRSSHKVAAETGKMHTGGSRQFGFNRDGTVNDAEAAVVLEVVERILGGESLRRIAFDLNARGVRTTRGNEWSSSTLGAMIRSPRLGGLRAYKGTVLPGQWTPVIPPETHYEVLAALDRPQPAKRTTRRHLLTGVAECGICGGALKTMGQRLKDGRSFPRYQCVRQPGAKNCGKLAITKNSLETFVVSQVLRHLAAGYMLPLSDEITRIEELRRSIEADRQSLSELTEERYVRRTISATDYEANRDLLQGRLVRSEEQLVAMERQQKVTSSIPMRRGNLDDLRAWWEAASEEERRATIGEMIARVRVNPATRRGNTFDPTRVYVGWSWDAVLGSAKTRSLYMSDEEREEELREAQEEAEHWNNYVEAQARALVADRSD